MKIVILGGCGFIGSNLAIFLKKKINKVKVVSVDNLSRKGSILNFKRLKNNGITNLTQNISKINSLKNLGKVDLFINCCSDPAIENSKKDTSSVINNNFITTLMMLNYAIKYNSGIIYLSTSRVYSIEKINNFIKNKNLINKLKIRAKINENFNTSDVRSIYGLTKLFSEELIKEYSYLFKLKYIINRCGVVSGPWQLGKQEQGLFSFWVKKHILRQPIKFIGYGGHGNQIRDVLHIDDLNDLIFKQIKKIKKINNFVLNVGGGPKNSISLLELTKACEKITKNKCKKTKQVKTSNYDIPYYVTDNKKVTRIYDWKPKKSINTLLKDLYDWMVNNKKLINKF